MKRMVNTIKPIAKIVVVALCFLSLIPVFLNLFFSGNQLAEFPQTENVSLIDAFDGFIARVMSDAEEGARSVYKRFWINKDAASLPLRDDEKYGTADSPSELQWLIDEAAPLLNGQKLLFNTEIQILKGTKITYYLDESILAICWQQVLNRMVYTIAEVKVVDPAQFRRYLSDDCYESGKRLTTAQLSEQAGAVLACSGDYFLTRPHGIVVYEGEVKRYHNCAMLDSCFVDYGGNFILVPRKTFQTKEQIDSFVNENNINFSLAFGPILVKDGVLADPPRYPIGEIDDGYPRAAICQKDELHYLCVVTNGNGENRNYPTVHMFAEQVFEFDVQQAYALDGGRTGAIVMEDQFLNRTEYRAGPQLISDILSFVTAVPDQK